METEASLPPFSFQPRPALRHSGRCEAAIRNLEIVVPRTISALCCANQNLRETHSMKVPELRERLATYGLRPYAVSIDGVDATEEQYRLERDGKYWITYYYERENKAAVHDFASEDEACDYFFEWLQKDLTVRRP